MNLESILIFCITVYTSDNLHYIIQESNLISFKVHICIRILSFRMMMVIQYRLVYALSPGTCELFFITDNNHSYPLPVQWDLG